MVYGYVADWTSGFSFQDKEVFCLRHFEQGGLQVEFSRRIEIECMGFFIKIPFPFGIQFFKDVFYHAVGVVHTHLAVVLKSAFQYQFALGVFAFDAVLVASPFSAVHGVQITSRGAAPVFYTFG